MKREFWIVNMSLVFVVSIGATGKRVDNSSVTQDVTVNQIGKISSVRQTLSLAKTVEGYSTITISKAEELRKTGRLNLLSVETDSDLPQSVSLFQPIPNPFHQKTLITFTLPASHSISLKIYDVAGRLVRTLLEEEKEAGIYMIPWDGRRANGERVSSGIYFYRLTAREFVATRKLVIIM